MNYYIQFYQIQNQQKKNNQIDFVLHFTSRKKRLEEKQTIQ